MPIIDGITCRVEMFPVTTSVKLHVYLIDPYRFRLSRLNSTPDSQTFKGPYDSEVQISGVEPHSTRFGPCISRKTCILCLYSKDDGLSRTTSWSPYLIPLSFLYQTPQSVYD